MKPQRKFCLFIGLVFGSVACFAGSMGSGLAAAPEAKALPRSLVMATHAVGTGFHADGSALAKLVSDRSPMTMIVRPHPGPPAWLPAMDKGEIEFGVLTGPDAAAAYRGIAAYRRAFPNIRLFMIGAPLYVAFWAPMDSPIRTVADLHGKRVPSGWSDLPMIAYNSGANLATAGLTWDDVVKVPVAELGENLRAFLEGRTDVLWHSVGTPAVREANARVRGGIRLLAIGTSPGGLKRMGEINPGSYMVRLKKGAFLGIMEDVPVQTNDEYVVVSQQLPEEIVSTVLRVLWDHNDEVRKVTARMRGWTRERTVSRQAAVPYHPGAIKFYREKGIWSSEMDGLQQRLLTG